MNMKKLVVFTSQYINGKRFCNTMERTDVNEWLESNGIKTDFHNDYSLRKFVKSHWGERFKGNKAIVSIADWKEAYGIETKKPLTDSMIVMTIYDF